MNVIVFLSEINGHSLVGVQENIVLNKRWSLIVWSYRTYTIDIYWVTMVTGTALEFKRKFETPILRGRDADATDADHKKGQEKLQEV